MSKKKEERAARTARAGKYKAQAARTARNKLRACERHVEKHPADTFGRAQLDARRRAR